MRLFQIIAASILALSVAASPVPGKRAIDFQLQAYPEFQISDGVAGDSEARAAAIVVPFAGQDLSTVTDQQRDDLATMREAAEAAETTFNDAIEAAGGTDTDAGAALQRGKIANKVLKLTLIGVFFDIKGDTVKLAESQKKLANNIAQDVEAAGLPMTSVQG